MAKTQFYVLQHHTFSQVLLSYLFSSTFLSTMNYNHHSLPQSSPCNVLPLMFIYVRTLKKNQFKRQLATTPAGYP